MGALLLRLIFERATASICFSLRPFTQKLEMRFWSMKHKRGRKNAKTQQNKRQWNKCLEGSFVKVMNFGESIVKQGAQSITKIEDLLRTCANKQERPALFSTSL
jgi:hypothetical protein